MFMCLYPVRTILADLLDNIGRKKIRRRVFLRIRRVERDRYRPSFLRISFGMAFLLTITEIVLYATNGREKYQYPS